MRPPKGPGPDPKAYPCTVYIKVVGHAGLRFEALVQALVSPHVPTEDLLAVTERPSREGHYVSVTFTVCARSRDQLDTIYQSFAGRKEILLAL